MKTIPIRIFIVRYLALATHSYIRLKKKTHIDQFLTLYCQKMF